MAQVRANLSTMRLWRFLIMFSIPKGPRKFIVDGADFTEYVTETQIGHEESTHINSIAVIMQDVNDTIKKALKNKKDYVNVEILDLNGNSMVVNNVQLRRFDYRSQIFIRVLLWG